jgi:hypothetical protein
MWKGEGFGLVKLPPGSRVVYAPEPFEALEDPEGAIRHALEHPTGDSDPLYLALAAHGLSPLVGRFRTEGLDSHWMRLIGGAQLLSDERELRGLGVTDARGRMLLRKALAQIGALE